MQTGTEEVAFSKQYNQKSEPKVFYVYVVEISVN
jgi:hypothetical protein